MPSIGKSKMIDSRDDILAALDEEFKAISVAVDNMAEKIMIAKNDLAIEYRNRRKQHPYIVKRVIRYLANGINIHEAYHPHG